MRILYIDNRRYGHNADLHIKFFQYMHKRKYNTVFGYGLHMNEYFEHSKRPNMSNIKKDFFSYLIKTNPDIILTYNCNGSSYEIGADNIQRYRWIEESLRKVSNIPKFHITTDYCRSGFRQEQADWFKDLGYTASFFRHKVALDYPLEVDKYWLPFSVDKRLYLSKVNKNVSAKKKRVAFLGAAHNSAQSLYANRIAAIDYLDRKKLMSLTPIIDKKKTRKMLFGDNYVKFWTDNLFGLTCGGTCNFMTAKYFQIPASYSMLVCTETKGLEIFPEDTYITYSKDNLEKLGHDISDHIKNLSDTEYKINKLHKYVIKKHNHDSRILKFNKIIKRYL